ncbi:hypothetical protein [Plantactinospora sp. DSM 117369]
MRSKKPLPLAIATIATLLTLVGCGNKSGEQTYSDKLRSAGFDAVAIDRDVEKSGKKKKLVAYDLDWTVNLDQDSVSCTVELEHPATSSGALKGDHWHIDEVNGSDISGWGAESPDAEAVRRLLRQHGYDC